MKRSSGILLHISSLPSPYGIGNLGRAAREFVDFLVRAGQSCWQILPISPTGYGDSPYQSASSFAGNPYFIDPDALAAQGLLTAEDLTGSWGDDPGQADFGLLYLRRYDLLRKAFGRFRQDPDFDGFCRAEASWLNDYALFMAIKQARGGKPWTQWEAPLRLRQPQALAQAEQTLADEIRFQKWMQFVFYGQWRQLRAYANGRGIRIIGDIPIYVPLDSADVWSDPDSFLLDEDRRPTVVAGCPPDSFNADGQFWGNPIYDWRAMERDGFSWWVRRIGAAVRFFDVIRIDHFRGIESYWSIPGDETTARNGRWVKGPGMALIRAIQKAWPNAEFIAEDLGFLTQEVLDLVAESGFPGMKVLEFAFDPTESDAYLPHRYTENCICYTGTHDNKTLHQWYGDGDIHLDFSFARQYMKLADGEDFCEAVLRLGLASRANLFMAQLQDYLKLGAEGRMNKPGEVNSQNWRWRLLPGAADGRLADEIAALTKTYDRA